MGTSTAFFGVLKRAAGRGESKDDSGDNGAGGRGVDLTCFGVGWLGAGVSKSIRGAKGELGTASGWEETSLATWSKSIIEGLLIHTVCG